MSDIPIIKPTEVIVTIKIKKLVKFTRMKKL
jgi:hypothetical protein